MSKITTIGLDLAKQVFHAVMCNQWGKVLAKKKLSRNKLLAFFAQQEACVVGMEACATSHHWARELTALGHEVRMVPAQHVKAYLRGNKNDYNDALAIAEAARNPEMRLVTLKTEAQQDLQSLFRVRDLSIKTRTALCNQMRGLLAEYGIIIPKSINALRRRLPEILEDAENGLSDAFRRLLADSYTQLGEVEKHIQTYDSEIDAYCNRTDACVRLQSIPGFGPKVAGLFYCVIGDGHVFRRGRDVSASLGVVPGQHSTGDKPVLLGISKRGDRRLRVLLVQGARNVVKHAVNKDDSLSRWINRIRKERGFHKAAVALANKMARIGWAVLHDNTVYQPDFANAQ